MRVRDATRADLPAIVAIYNEDILTTTSSWRDDPQTLEEREASFDALGRRGFPTIVAEDAGRIFGVAVFGDFRDSIVRPGYRFTVEHSVHVACESWGRGVGQMLMAELFERAERRRVHAMIGGIDAANTRSLSFHERLGFREVARLPETGWKHDHWCDLVFVQRLIDAPGSPRDGGSSGRAE